jgi:hypothetical protein
VLRKRLAMERTPLHRFRVRLARTADDYESAFRLVQASYVALGIDHALTRHLRMTSQHVLPEAWVLLAEEGGLLVGTMTVTLDSPARLPLDADYPSELDALRTAGARLCEFGTLAVVERRRHSGVSNLLNMAAVTIATQRLQATHLVAGVHPTAIEFYRAAYHFEQLGPAKGHANLEAPVAGMVSDLAVFHRFLEKAFPTPLPTGSLAADHFFGVPLPCIELPPGDHVELLRWKLSREVFQELFNRRTNHLATLDEKTRRYLEQFRSPTTLHDYQRPRLVKAS